jgi:ElaB/YqjD/DUF883 family membrane-anchored ribosome-binding protein
MMDVQSARQELSSDFRSLSSHAEELLRMTASMSGEGVAAAPEKLSRSLRTFGDSMKKAEGYTREAARQVADTTDSYVHGKPWQAIGVALLAGVAIGLISRGGRD